MIAKRCEKIKYFKLLVIKNINKFKSSPGFRSWNDKCRFQNTHKLFILLLLVQYDNVLKLHGSNKNFLHFINIGQIENDRFINGVSNDGPNNT